MKILSGVILCVASLGMAQPALASEDGKATVQQPPKQPPKQNGKADLWGSVEKTIRFGGGRQGFDSENTLREALAGIGTTPSLATVEAPVSELQTFFSDRARRQQVFMDGGSLVTVLGVAGAFASGGAGLVTQGYWGAAGFAPILASNFNAYEPTRELYEIGSRGIDLIRARYRGMAQSKDLVTKADKSASETAAGHKELERVCAKLTVRLDRLAGQGPSVYRQVLLPEMDRLAKLCLQTRETRARLKLATGALPDENRLAYAYGMDVLALRDDLKERDRSVRYTPLQTLSSMLAAPFLTVGATLAGSNGAASVASVAEAAALRAFEVPLWSWSIPALPAPLDEGVMVSPVTDSVVSAAIQSTDRAVIKAAGKLELRPALDDLVATAAVLRSEALGLNSLRTELERFRGFESLDTLRASADPVSRQGQVRLQPRGATEAPAAAAAPGPATPST